MIEIHNKLLYLIKSSKDENMIIDNIIKKIKEKIFKKIDITSLTEIIILLSALRHRDYSKLINHSELNILIEKLKNIKIENNENLQVIFNFNILLLTVPYIEGNFKEVYKQIMELKIVDKYFNNIRNIHKFISSIKIEYQDKNSNISGYHAIKYNINDMMKEAFDVFKEFSSENKLTDVAYELFLISDISFNKFFGYYNE